MAATGTKVTPGQMQPATAAMLPEAATRLRSRRFELFQRDAAEIQRQAVTALRRMATYVRSGCGIGSGDFDSRHRLAFLSLEAMTESWREGELWRLIDSEDTRAPQSGSELVLHVVAANTPLLAWSSVARALLIGAASLVRLPTASAEIDFWAERFQASLMNASPQLSELVEFARWPSDDDEATRAAARGSDVVVVYGSDPTVDHLRGLTPANALFLGYGHRFSIGVIGAAADYHCAAQGTALDMRIFDQQGCLSPQIVFVVGAKADATRFAELLAGHLSQSYSDGEPMPMRSGEHIARTREALMLAQFQPGTTVLRGDGLRWSIVISREAHTLGFSCPGTVTVVPADSVGDIQGWLQRNGLVERLQGISWAGDEISDDAREIGRFGASYVCAPGWLQRPPFTWREDNVDLLRSLMRPA